MRVLTKLPAIALWLFAPLAVAQSNLGQLLDAGAKKLSADEFKEELVQRVIFGPSATGGNVELIYASNGTVQGRGTSPVTGLTPAPGFDGEWKIDSNGNICTSIRIVGSGGVGTNLPFRCQPWFKYKDQYFLADSDMDRQARVLVRRVKQ